MGGKVGTKWRKCVKNISVFMLSCIKHACFHVFSPFSAYFSPHDIIAENGLLHLDCSTEFKTCLCDLLTDTKNTTRPLDHFLTRVLAVTTAVYGMTTPCIYNSAVASVQLQLCNWGYCTLLPCRATESINSRSVCMTMQYKIRFTTAVQLHACVVIA